MADFASLIGGGPDTVATGAADPDGAYAYFFTQGDIFLDLGAGGDNFSSIDPVGGAVNAGDASIFAGEGADTVVGGDGADLLAGGSGNDGLFGNGGNDFISGDEGDDTLQGAAGNDTVFGGSGNDRVDGGDGDDYVLGGEGNDTVFSTAGNDTVYGASGDDSVDGGIGDDFLAGGEGLDTLIGGEGDDTLLGGSGADSFYYFNGFGNDVISDLQTGDSIFLKADLNGTGIADAADVLPFVTGGTENGVNFTQISLGGDTIRLENVDQASFTSNISDFIKIVP